MTSLDLYRFISENGIEYNWLRKDVIVFIPMYLVQEWNRLLPRGLYDDSGIECAMKDGYIAMTMRDVCQYADIELEEVFTEKANA